MPDIDSFAKSYGLVVGLLTVAVLGLSRALVFLYRENSSVHEHLQTLLEERNKSLETMLDNAYRDRGPRA